VYKLAIATISMATILSAAGYEAAAHPSDARSAGGGSNSVPVRGSVIGPDGRPLAGADICVHPSATDEARSCTSSRADGSFALPPAAHERLIVTFVKDGFAPTMRAVETIGAESHNGPIAFLVTAPGAEPITASVTRTAAEGQAPFYFSVALDREQPEL
jgi:hypothetical protein